MTEACSPAIVQELVTDLQYYKQIAIWKGKGILVKISNGMLQTVDISSIFFLLVSCCFALASVAVP